MNTTRPKFVTAMLLMFSVAAAMLSTPVLAQIPPPALTTTIVPPPANQPFAAAFHYYWFPSAFGIAGWNGNGQANINISGNDITIFFDGGCGFICPGSLAYFAYPFTMPALQSGRYRVRFVHYGNPPSEIAAFDLDVAATPVPTASHLAIASLIGLMALLGTLHLRVRDRRFRYNAQSRLP